MKEKENHLETLEFHPLQSTESSNRRTKPRKEEDARHQVVTKYTTPVPLREAHKLSQRGKGAAQLKCNQHPFPPSKAVTRYLSQHATGIKVAINGQKKGKNKEKQIYMYRPSEIYYN